MQQVWQHNLISSKIMKFNVQLTGQNMSLYVFLILNLLITFHLQIRSLTERIFYRHTNLKVYDFFKFYYLLFLFLTVFVVF